MVLRVDFWDERNITQSRFILDNTKYSAFVGGQGAGKTWGGALKSLRYQLEHPGAKILVTSQTQAVIDEAVFPVYLQVFPSYLVAEARVGYPKRINLQALDDAHPPGEIFFCSWAEWQGLVAYSVDAIHFDEAAKAPYEAYLTHISRMDRREGYPGQLWITTTPAGYNWLFTQFPGSGDHPDHILFNCSTEENHFLDREVIDKETGEVKIVNTYVENLKQKYSGAWVSQFIHGLFVEVGGSCIFEVDRLNQFARHTTTPIETRANGMLKVWETAEVGQSYVVGVDPAYGQQAEGAARTAVQVLKKQTGKQVAVFVGFYPPDETAQLAVALSREYYNAFLVCESTGVGETVLRKIKETGYRNIYYADKKHENPGFSTQLQSKHNLIWNLEEKIRTGAIQIMDLETIDECFSYVAKGNKTEAATGKMDDLVMALAMAAWGLKERPYVATDRMPEALSFLALRG